MYQLLVSDTSISFGKEQAGVPCVVVPIKEFEIHVEILGVRIFVHRGMTCFHPE